MLVIGDLHLTENWIKRLQVENFMNWLNKQDCLINSKTIILLGDLFEIPTPPAYLVAFYLQLFSRAWADKNIIIVRGNHDVNLEEDSLDHFSYMDNVTIVKDLKELDIEGHKCLLLPHYNHEGTNKPPMHEYYSSLKGSYDYIFAHVMDETQSMGGLIKNVCDLSNIKGKKLFGHVHTPNVKQGGNYLGSAIKNSSTEKSDNKILALIKEESLEFIDVPSFMEYETVDYGEDISNKDTLVLLNVLNAPTKNEAQTFYETKYKNVKCNKIITKRQQFLDTEVVKETDDRNTWRIFCEEKKISEPVRVICETVI